jgi:hypothetical protein
MESQLISFMIGALDVDDDANNESKGGATIARLINTAMIPTPIKIHFLGFLVILKRGIRNCGKWHIMLHVYKNSTNS